MLALLPLHRLQPKHRSLLHKVLLLARSAPLPGQTESPPLDEQDGIFPYYNFELYQGLQALGLSVTPSRDLAAFVANPLGWDYVFTIFNRAPMRNPEVLVSTLCAFYHIPHLGAPPNIRALAEDKYATKLLAASLGIPVPPGMVYQPHSPAPAFAGPYFIKPRFGAASEEIDLHSVQDTWQQAEKVCQALYAKGKEVLVERCIFGVDVTQPVLGGPIMLPPAQEISTMPHGIVTYRQKRLLTSPRQRQMITEPALIATLTHYTTLLCQSVAPFDYLRVDYRWETASGRFFLLECNLACNLGTHAAVAQCAQHAGISHHALLEHIIAFSLYRQAPQRNLC